MFICVYTGKHMFRELLDNLIISASNDDFDSRRAHERRTCDNCIAIINGKAFPIQNWSQGGLLLSGDPREFQINETKNVAVKFKVEDRVIDVEHNGRILRKGGSDFVVQFSPLTKDIDKKFQQIIDDDNARQFANSQQ